MRFVIDVCKTVNATIEVEAASEEEARDRVNEGEVTAQWHSSWEITSVAERR